MKYTIGTFEFASKAAAKAALANIANIYHIGAVISKPEHHALLLQVVSVHPWHKALKPENILSFRVARNEFGGKTIKIVKVVGDDVALAYSRIFEKRNPTKREVFVAACRRAVARQIIEFKSNAFPPGVYQIRCAITDEWTNKADIHVDHVYPFECMVRDWERQTDHNYSAENIRAFAIHHLDHAQLRCVSTKANLSRRDDTCE